MRKVFFSILFFSFILFITGCGKRAYVDYQPNKLPVMKGNISKVLVLPFSSYSLSKSPKTWMQANILLYDSITDNFATHKILSVPFDDVFTILKQNGFLKFNHNEVSPGLVEEFNNMQWSSAMRKEIGTLIYEEKVYKNKNNELEPILYLTEDKIFKINKTFNADYILRGSITELTVKKEETFNPFKIGFINAPLKFLSRALNGVGETDSWARGQEVLTGILTGAILGSFANEPFQAPGHKTTTVPLLGTTVKERGSGPTDYQWGNAAFWGAMTGFSAFIASHGANIPEITVGLRLYFYNAKTKELVWTNRVKLHVTPESQWSKQNVNELINYAIKQSVDTILKSFWDDNFIKIANK